MARRVARAVAHLQCVAAQCHGVAVSKPAGGLESASRREAIHGRSLCEAFDPELVTRVRADDGQLQLLGQIGCACGMVHVAVGDPDLFELEVQLFDGPQQHMQIAARIDDRRLARLVVPDQGAVLLEGRDGDGLVLQHAPIIW